MPSSEAGPLERARENVVGIVSVLVTGIWLAALVSGFQYWLALLLLGYIVVVPLTAMLFGDEDDIEEHWGEDATVPDEGVSETQTDPQDALATLRDRYARGDLTDEQFERKLERLLETETLEDVEDRARAERQSRPVDDRDVEPETER